MLAKTESVALVGTEARLVEVEVHVGTGLPAFRIVGLPAKSVTEAEQRTRAALVSSEQRWPPHRITANLAPGGLPKEGTHYDLGIALGVLAADENAKTSLPLDALKGFVFVGELGLDGTIRSVRGVLAAAIAAHKHGSRGLVCPVGNASEAHLVEGLRVIPVASLRECIDVLLGRSEPVEVPPPREFEATLLDLSDVRGQHEAKSALIVAAAGGHNVLMSGPPGSGKSLLAKCLPGVLPQMSYEESLDVTTIFSVAGLLPENSGLVKQRPFRAPHHHISPAGLLGGGARLATPGEISLAHRGVLFLDELPLFRHDVIESLRAPLEEGVIRLARSGGAVAYPCAFSMVAAMNPCPCGYLGDHSKECRCSDYQLERYDARISGPLLDRIDIETETTRLTKEELLGPPDGETSSEVRARVEAARLMQTERYSSSRDTNGSVSKRKLLARLSMTKEARTELSYAIDSMALTGRGVDRALRVARTVADLRGSELLDRDAMTEALLLRSPKERVAA